MTLPCVGGEWLRLLPWGHSSSLAVWRLPWPAWEGSAGDRQYVNIDPGKEVRRPNTALTSLWKVGVVRGDVLTPSSPGVGDTWPSSPLELLEVAGGGSRGQGLQGRHSGGWWKAGQELLFLCD